MQSNREKYARLGDFMLSERISTNSAEILTGLLKKVSGIRRLKKILIVGGNSGYEEKLITEIVPDAIVINTDISSTALSVSEAQINTQSSVLDLPFREQSFDLVVALRVLHIRHIWGVKDKYPSQLARVIKDSGLLLTSIPTGTHHEEETKVGSGIGHSEKTLSHTSENHQSFLIDDFTLIDSDASIIEDFALFQLKQK